MRIAHLTGKGDNHIASELEKYNVVSPTVLVGQWVWTVGVDTSLGNGLRTMLGGFWIFVKLFIESCKFFPLVMNGYFLRNFDIEGGLLHRPPALMASSRTSAGVFKDNHCFGTAKGGKMARSKLMTFATPSLDALARASARCGGRPIVGIRRAFVVAVAGNGVSIRDEIGEPLANMEHASPTRNYGDIASADGDTVVSNLATSLMALTNRLHLFFNWNLPAHRCYVLPRSAARTF